MNRLQEFCQRVEKNGILGVSGAIFKDHKNPKGGKYKANTTPEQHCQEMGDLKGVSAEMYADELLNIMDAPAQTIIGECKKCFKFLTENEIHECDGDGHYLLPNQETTK
ncbi:MAG: hypothetical protein QM500_19875 [Methylococcales bacterium]